MLYIRQLNKMRVLGTKIWTKQTLLVESFKRGTKSGFHEEMNNS